MEGAEGTVTKSLASLAVSPGQQDPFTLPCDSCLIKEAPKCQLRKKGNANSFLSAVFKNTNALCSEFREVWLQN